MRPRRVLLLVSQVFANGGVQRFNRTLLTALETLGIECEVLSLADTAEAQAAGQKFGPGIRVRGFSGRRTAFAAGVARALLFGDHDLVLLGHVHFLELAMSLRSLRRRAPRLFLVVHGVEIWDRLRGSRRRWMSRVDRILCVSRYTADSIRAQAPELPAGRIAIFPNALADLWVEQARRHAAATSAPRAGRYLLSVARLTRHDRRKGIATTLDAFARLADRELRYVIAGAGEDLTYLRNLARRLGVAERVEFSGAVSDAELVALYRDCEAFVLPSGQEGFGIVFLEAMFFGAPVIAAREKGAVDVIRHEETGLLVPYGDVDALHAALARVIADPELRTRLRTLARAEVTGEGPFTATAFARRLDGLLDSRRAPRLVFVNRYFHPDESATSRMLSDLARRLSRAGTPVTVVTSRQLYDNAAANLPEHDEVDGVVVLRVGAASRGRAKLLGRALDYLDFHRAAGLRLLRMLTPDDVVIAKTDPPLLGVTVALAARARGATLVNWLQDLFPEVADQLGVPIRPRWLGGLLESLRNASLRQAACNVAIGARMAERLVAADIPAQSIRVIPNWADVEEITPRPIAGNPVRARLGIDEQFVIGYSGNLGRAHEYQTFLGAARLLAESPDYLFLVTGGGAKVEALRQEVRASGLASFRFQGYQASGDLADSMAAADVHLVSLLPATEGLIVPSKYYGIMAAGRPAIFIGDLDGELAREIRASGTGAVIAVGDSEGLARELRRLREDPLLTATLSLNARQQAEKRHNSSRAMSAWLSLVAELPPARATAAPALVPDVQSGT